MDLGVWTSLESGELNACLRSLACHHQPAVAASDYAHRLDTKMLTKNEC